MQKVHRLLLTFFYSGLAKKAPGTCGSIASVIFWLLINCLVLPQTTSLLLQNVFWFSLIFLTFVYGSLAAPTYVRNLGKNSKEIDDQTIVLDEFVGQVFALQFSYNFIAQSYHATSSLSFVHMALCFVLFRFFDIKKPLLIGYVDRQVKSGLGVMLDDLLSGVIAGIIAALLILLVA